MSDLAKLFAIDPLELTDPDLDTIIEHFRTARVNFNLGPKAAPAKKAAPKQKVEQIDLDDLLKDM